RCQGAELLGDHERRVIRQHDAAGTNTDRIRARGNVPDDDRGRGARDARNVVVLGHPEAAIAPVLCVPGELARIVERSARIGVLGDADQIEYGKRYHRSAPDSAQPVTCHPDVWTRVANTTAVPDGVVLQTKGNSGPTFHVGPENWWRRRDSDSASFDAAWTMPS